MVNRNGHFAAADRALDSVQETNRIIPGCQEWRDLLQAYPAAMQQYCQAVVSLLSLEAATFNEGWRKAEQARKVCETYREKLFHHRHEHRCFTVSGS